MCTCHEIKTALLETYQALKELQEDMEAVEEHLIPDPNERHESTRVARQTLDRFASLVEQVASNQ